jgi:D-alanine-D-alanine ligase
MTAKVFFTNSGVNRIEFHPVRIHDYAQKAYQATRSRGVARIDFMYTPSGELYLTEINPIPGSMAFYLWEANGVSFTQQISDSIDEALKQSQYDTSLHLEHTSKIVEKFISQ